MALTQMLIIQSLEKCDLVRKGVSWGVPATELKHLTGRIGELYVALITNGRMATEVNQAGYGVTSSLWHNNRLKRPLGSIQAVI